MSNNVNHGSDGRGPRPVPLVVEVARPLLRLYFAVLLGCQGVRRTWLVRDGGSQPG